MPGCQSQRPRAYSVRGVAWEKKGEHDKAIADYSQVLRSIPRTPKPMAFVA